MRARPAIAAFFVAAGLALGGLGAACAPARAEAFEDAVEPVPDDAVEPAEYLQDMVPADDPAQEARLRALVDEMVAARLAGIRGRAISR
jgi:hypothetical protein